MRRFSWGLVLAALMVLLVPAAAQAHALVVSSDPPAGVSLTQVPKTVTLTFSEAPAPAQSSIDVLDGAGHSVTKAHSYQVPKNPLQLAVALKPLLNGVYTVRWHTISKDDGHASSGSFTFGVGPAAYAAMGGPAPALVSAPSSTDPAVVAGHWVFYAGLGLLVGGCWVTLFALAGADRRLLAVTAIGGVATLAGLAGYGMAQAHMDGTPLSQLPSTSLGLGLFAQGFPALVSAASAAVALRWAGRTRVIALTLAAVAAGAAILLHVLTTHAASGSNTLLEVVAQWAHITAFATWIGGLAALLIAVGTEPSPAKTAAVRRFSQVAGFALAALILSGLLRALDEVAHWSSLFDSLFGGLVLVKVGLVVVLAGLGALNRYRSVPAAGESLRGLRRIGRIEISVAGMALVVAAILASLLPPALASSAAKQTPSPHTVVLADSSGIAASLDVSPGYPGLNSFLFRAHQGSTTIAGDVSLRFELPARPDIPATLVKLQRDIDGGYSGVSSDLTLTGDWTVTAVLQKPTGSVEIPFELSCALSPQQISQMTMGRMTMAYGIPLAGGWQLEAYLTPGHPGENTLHLIFTDQRNAPVDVPDVPTVTMKHDGTTKTLSIRRLAFGTPQPNSFYASSMFTPGRWDFHVDTTTPSGGRIAASFSLTINK